MLYQVYVKLNDDGDLHVIDTRDYFEALLCCEANEWVFKYDDSVYDMEIREVPEPCDGKCYWFDFGEFGDGIRLCREVSLDEYKSTNTWRIFMFHKVIKVWQVFNIVTHQFGYMKADSLEVLL